MPKACTPMTAKIERMMIPSRGAMLNITSVYQIINRVSGLVEVGRGVAGQSVILSITDRAAGVCTKVYDPFGCHTFLPGRAGSEPLRPIPLELPRVCRD
jgi:hypothetical protein